MQPLPGASPRQTVPRLARRPPRRPDPPDAQTAPGVTREWRERRPHRRPRKARGPPVPDRGSSPRAPTASSVSRGEGGASRLPGAFSKDATPQGLRPGRPWHPRGPTLGSPPGSRAGSRGSPAARTSSGRQRTLRGGDAGRPGGNARTARRGSCSRAAAGHTPKPLGLTGRRPQTRPAQRPSTELGAASHLPQRLRGSHRHRPARLRSAAAADSPQNALPHNRATPNARPQPPGRVRLRRGGTARGPEGVSAGSRGRPEVSDEGARAAPRRLRGLPRRTRPAHATHAQDGGAGRANPPA